MGLMLWSNNAKTTLAGSIASDATTANLASGTGALFPNPTDGNYFALTFVDAATKLISEITYVTARSGDTVTIVRGQEGTTARAWTAGDIASNLWTAGAAVLGAQPPTLQAQAGNYAVDSGTANAVVVTLSPVPSTLAAISGAPLRIKKSGAANTSAVTIAVNGLAATPLIYADGTAIGAAELPANGIFSAVFDGTNFIVQSTASAAGGITATQLQAQGGNYATDSGAANAAVVALSPIPTTLAALVGVPIRVKKVASNNTGAITLAVNGLAATPIKLTDGTDPLNAMLQASAIFSVIYDGTNFELQSPPAGLAPLNAPALVNPTATTPTSPTDNTQKVATTQWAYALAQAQPGNFFVDTGTANAVAITVAPAPSVLSSLSGAPLRIRKSANANSGAYITTLTINSLPAKSIVYPQGGTTLPFSTLPANAIFEVIYDSATDTFVLMTPNIFASLGANGSEHSPSGLLTQWGTTPPISQDTGSYAITFPYPYAAGCQNATAVLLNPSAGTSTNYDQGVHVVSWDRYTLTVLVQAYGSASTSQAFAVSWQALGH